MARVVAPMMGKFLQTDPIGYGDGMNIYAYVKGDPMNSVDPTGLGALQMVSRFLSYVFSWDPNDEVNMYSDSGWGGADCNGSCPALITVGGGWVSDEFVAVPTIRSPGANSIINANNYFNDPTPALMQGGTGIGGGGDSTPQNGKSPFCRAARLLGQNGRLRLGADAAGGVGSFGDAGFGVSLRGDGSFEFDGYVGFGVGIGAFGGVGLGIDNAGGTEHGGNRSGGTQVVGGLGVPVYGPVGVSATGSAPFSTSADGTPTFGDPSGGGGWELDRSMVPTLAPWPI